MPTEKYTRGPEILEHCQRIAKHFGLYDNACLSTEVTGLEWDGESSRWIIRTNRGDTIRARFVAMGTGPLHRPKLPGHPRRRDVPRPQLPHQPMGLRIHRRRPRGRADGSSRRQARRDHRHRSDGRAMRPAPGSSVRRAVRVPTHAVVDRRPRQPPDRRRVVLHARPRLAGPVADELHDPADRRLRRRGPRAGRLDRHCPAHPRQGPGRPGPRLQPGGHRAGVPRERRREDDRDPRPGRRLSSPTARPPTRSSRGTASYASGRASTTSTCRRSTRLARTWSTRTARASSASTRPASWSAGSTTSSTA